MTLNDLSDASMDASEASTFTAGARIFRGPISVNDASFSSIVIASTSYLASTMVVKNTISFAVL